jgi:hypothetical protein
MAFRESPQPVKINPLPVPNTGRQNQEKSTKQRDFRATGSERRVGRKTLTHLAEIKRLIS